MAYENILVDKKDGVGAITLNRPEALNALNDAMMTDVLNAIAEFEKDETIGCLVLAGSSKAFAAGADIKEISSATFLDMYLDDPFTRLWESIARCRKPVVAAVAGYALGGGCEIAMMCDIIIAAENAKFGQPEITIGVMPGAGGTQRLTRAVGKSKAMEMCLTGRMMGAEEAERANLVSRIVPVDDLMDEAMSVAAKIAEMSTPIAMMTKESVNRAFETPLTEGIKFERRLFAGQFSTEDQKEGMAAFAEKRTARFRNK